MSKSDITSLSKSIRMELFKPSDLTRGATLAMLRGQSALILISTTP